MLSMTTWLPMVTGTICPNMAGVGNRIAGWVIIIIRGLGSILVFGGICRGVAGAGCRVLISAISIGSTPFAASPVPGLLQTEQVSTIKGNRERSGSRGQIA